MYCGSTRVCQGVARCNVRFALAALTCLLCLLLYAAPGGAATGYFPAGWGTVSKGMAGATVALDGESPLAGANNPAAIMTVPDHALQLDVYLLYPMPKVRVGDYPASPTGSPQAPAFPVHPGTYKSKPTVPLRVFEIPQLGMNWRIGDKMAVGLVVYGNGGMNDTYPGLNNPDCPPGTAGRGLFCGGTVELDVKQVFVSPVFAAQPYAWLRVGISPILAVESFKIKGLSVFSGQSAHPAHVSDTGRDYGVGLGYKLGVQVQALPGLALGAVYQTRIDINPMSRYKGLLPSGGRLDIPSMLEVGLAWNFMPRWTATFDWQRVYYSDSAALSNDPATPADLGSVGGPGFGWRDVNAYKLGIRWAAAADWVLRAGYARVDPVPVRSNKLFFNMIAQSIMRDHYTLGASWDYSKASTLDAALLYTPVNSVAGDNPHYPGQRIRVSLGMIGLNLSWRHRF